MGLKCIRGTHFSKSKLHKINQSVSATYQHDCVGHIIFMFQKKYINFSYNMNYFTFIIIVFMTANNQSSVKTTAKLGLLLAIVGF